MNFPIDFHLGSYVIQSHLVFEFLAFTFGYWYYRYLTKRQPKSMLSDEMESKVIIGLIIGAFLGSRLIAALENPFLFLHPISWLYYVGSQTIAGAIIGGILGVEITKKIIGLKRRTGDLFVFPLMFAIMIGRVGCFLTGVTDGTVGLPSSLPWAFDQGDGIARHPTSAYEIVFLIILFFVLKYIDSHRSLMKSNIFTKEGDLFRLFVIGYGLFRVFVEYLKPIHTLVLGLSSIQIVSLIAVVYYVYYFIHQYLILPSPRITTP